MPTKIDYDESHLIELHSKGLLTIEIAKVMGVSHDTINRWMKKAGLQFHRNIRTGKRSLKLDPIKDEIICKYTKQNKTTYELADEYNVNHHTVGTALRRWGVDTHRSYSIKKRVDPAKVPKTLRDINRDELQSLYDQYSSRQLAKILGYSHTRVQKAIKYHGIKPRSNSRKNP